MTRKNRAVSLAVLFAMVLLLIPPFGGKVAAAVTLDGGVIVIDEEFVADNGTEFIITGDVYSVTVIGNVNVSIIFDNVKIDRTKDTEGSTAPDGLYEAGQRLSANNGWKTQGTSQGNTSYYAPTCPFLITGGAGVTARFDGDCIFKAGYNGWYVRKARNGNETLRNDYTYTGGYAGIQVDSGASLTIAGATNLKAYGAHQIAGVDTNDSSTNNSNYYNSETGEWDVIKINSMWSGSWSDYPPNTSNGSSAGGAGIGGGVSYDTTTMALSGNGYTAGTPGEIIIDNGEITAVGGHLAAGIGGGVNGAATSQDSKIEINGGNITAIGGRYACGIGDGDSLGSSQNISGCYAYNYDIIINGGTVNAYGGTAAAAIGTTDKITDGNGLGYDVSSGLSITIAGGTVNAQSGEATGDSSATAAIGAGEGTDMADNSITIYHEAEILAVSFSDYAISNYGVLENNAVKIPTVNIDPEGYVYLARFESQTTEREFKLYAIHRNANGHLIYVSTTADDIADGVGTDVAYYAYDPGHISADGKEIGGFYLVDENGNSLAPSDYEGNEGNYTVDYGRYYPKTISSGLSAYYDTNTVLETITVPGKYKAIAVTLPHPDEYGGAYVLEVPTSGSHTYVLFEKENPGVTSGNITGSSGTHISDASGDNTDGIPNPPASVNRTPNITVDTTAVPLWNLAVGTGAYAEGYEDTEADLIGDFENTVFGYTFYVPNGTKDFWIYFEYYRTFQNPETLAIMNAKHVLTGDYSKETQNEEVTPLEVTVTGELKEGRADVWIKKTDTEQGSGSSKTVTYKITIIEKDLYTLNLNSLDKIYDGNAVNASFSDMLEGTTDVTSKMLDEEKNSIVYTYHQDTDNDGIYETDLGTNPPKDAGKYIVAATLDADKYEAKGELAFMISKREIQIVAIQNWLMYVVAKDGEIYLTAQDTTPYNGVISAPGTIYFENVVSGDAVDLKKDADGKYISEFYYEDTTVAYGEQKIIIKNPVLSDDSDKNYYLTYTENVDETNYSKVPGQIAYKTDAAIFRKTATNTSLWRKFYPSTLDKFIDFDGDYDGVYSDAPTPDYHSPHPYGTEDNRTNLAIHREYVKLRTVGDTSARYSVDIEFGAMQFEYTKTVWNVNTGKYEEVEGESKWNGNDGVNNAVTVTNRSNADIAFDVSFEIEFMYASTSTEADSGIRAAIYDATNNIVAGETKDGTLVPGKAGTTSKYILFSASPGDAATEGVAKAQTVYLVLSNVPSSITQVETSGGQSYSHTNVGSVTVTLRDPTETS